jgi:hypothetical protein
MLRLARTVILAPRLGVGAPVQQRFFADAVEPKEEKKTKMEPNTLTSVRRDYLRALFDLLFVVT